MVEPSSLTVNAATGRRLPSFARNLGVALEPLAQSVGIDMEDFQHPSRRLRLDAFMRLLHLLEIVSGDDSVGLRYALHFQQGDTGPFGFALMHAPSLGKALEIYRTYQRVAADYAHFDVREGNDEVSVDWNYARPIDYPVQYTDLTAGLLVKMARHFLGDDWVPRRAQLLRGRPRNGALHREQFGSGLTFNSSAFNRISFAAADLDAASGRDDPRLFEIMEENCRTALAALSQSRDLRLQVADQILALLPAGAASLPRVAAELAIGERSLQRRLGSLGTHFEAVLEETRRGLSDRLLAGDTPLAEISYRCGYSNASAYSRAARGWYGMSPQAMRLHLRVQDT